MTPTILFDLDGTLTDPKLGITRCIAHALSELGYACPDAEALHWCIGPPLQVSFAQLLQTVDRTQINQAVQLYRDRYATVGLFENTLYPTIPEALQTIRAAGYQTFVATAKPTLFATQIIKHFQLDTLFDRVYGSELDGTRSTKSDLIEHILRNENLSIERTIMVGDREHDMIGAKHHGMTAIGVTYGYGTEQELTQHGATWIAHTPHEIVHLVCSSS